MKKCLADTEIIDRYFDGELDGNRMSELEEHLRTCESCKNEYRDIFNTIKLCREIREEELPENFKEELHLKLQESQSRQENPGRKPAAVVFRNRYFRLASTVAAVFLLVFLVRGVYYNTGVLKFMSGSTSSTDSAANMAAMENEKNSGLAQPAAEAGSAETFSMAAAPEARANVMSASGGAGVGGIEACADQAEGLTSKSEPDRSTVKSREITASKEFDDSTGEEYTQSRFSEIVINAEDYSKNLELISELAVKNSGIEKDEGIQYLIYLIPNENYDRFVSEIVSNVGQANVIIYGPFAADMTEVIRSLKTRINEIKEEISQKENGDREKWTEEIEELRKEKINIECLIEKIRLESDYTTINIKPENTSR